MTLRCVFEPAEHQGNLFDFSSRSFGKQMNLLRFFRCNFLLFLHFLFIFFILAASFAANALQERRRVQEKVKFFYYFLCGNFLDGFLK